MPANAIMKVRKARVWYQAGAITISTEAPSSFPNAVVVVARPRGTGSARAEIVVEGLAPINRLPATCHHDVQTVAETHLLRYDEAETNVVDLEIVRQW